MRISAKRHFALYAALNEPVMRLRVNANVEQRCVTDLEMSRLVTEQHALLITALNLKRGKLKAT
jgi:hypothetical protein